MADLKKNLLHNSPKREAQLDALQPAEVGRGLPPLNPKPYPSCQKPKGHLPSSRGKCVSAWVVLQIRVPFLGSFKGI